MFKNLKPEKQKSSEWLSSQENQSEPREETGNIPEISILREPRDEVPNFVARPPIVTRPIE